MKALDWFELVLELGQAAVAALKSGNGDKKVSDILPERYKDSELLKDLEDRARRDYAK